jgi:hypothetical protein
MKKRNLLSKWKEARYRGGLTGGGPSMGIGMISGGRSRLSPFRFRAYRISFLTHLDFFAAVDQKSKKNAEL